MMRIANITTEFNDIPNKITMTVFTPGCYRNCKGCHNESIKDFNIGKMVTAHYLLNEFNNRPLCNAICFSGGDPIYQPDLIWVLRFFKARGIYVGMYTGETYMKVNDKIIETLDFLVTEPWDEDCGPVTSETTNQRVWIRRGPVMVETTYNELLEDEKC